MKMTICQVVLRECSALSSDEMVIGVLGYRGGGRLVLARYGELTSFWLFTSLGQDHIIFSKLFACVIGMFA